MISIYAYDILWRCRESHAPKGHVSFFRALKTTDAGMHEAVRQHMDSEHDGSAYRLVRM